jgi:tellurium resistance protein TerZ
LSRDIIRGIVVNPDERTALLRKNDVVRAADYVPGGRMPGWVTLGLAWDVTDGVQIDLDVSVVCLDGDLNCVDLVHYGKKRSNDGSILHGGDEREGDVAGDDERINISLLSVDNRVKYLGFVINSFSGQELDDVAGASCHLFDTATRRDIASYVLSANRQLDKYTSLVMACLFREENSDEWFLRIISKPSVGRTADESVDHLACYLRANPPQQPSRLRIVDESDIDLSMPQLVHTNDQEIQLLPLISRKDHEVAA